MDNSKEHRTIAFDCNKREFTEYAMMVSRKTIRVFVIMYLVMGLLLVLLALPQNPEASVPLKLALFFVGGVMLLSALVRASTIKQQYEKVFDNSQNLWIRRAYTVSEDGIKVEGHDGSYSFTPWRSVVEIKESKSGIFFMLSMNYGLLVFDRAFPSDEECREFKSFSQQRFQKIRSGQ